ncbi:hypothetical protein Tco_1293238 [Tanacetum coccineum]
MKDQLLPVDASPIALSPDYIFDSDSEEDDEEDQRRILLTILPTEETMMIMSHLMMTTMIMMLDIFKGWKSSIHCLTKLKASPRAEQGSHCISRIQLEEVLFRRSISFSVGRSPEDDKLHFVESM